MATKTGISKSTVQRYFALFGLQPHRTTSFKRSTDPFFIEKVRDIVGLYLNPPDHALVLCVDEKSQIQALERTQPVLPLGLGYVEGITHDYIRHGTTTLFAALDIASGDILAQCKPRHRHQEFLSFLAHIDASVPKDLDVHLIVDNYATHKHAKVKAWLAKHPRYHLHSHCRHVLVQAAWSYHHRPAISDDLKRRQSGQPPGVIAHAWKAQHRLHKRYQHLSAHKPPQIAVVAVARELVGFLWAVMQDVPLSATSVMA